MAKSSKKDRGAQARARREVLRRKEQRSRLLRRGLLGLLAIAVVAAVATAILLANRKGHQKVTRLDPAAAAAGCNWLHTETFEAGMHIPQDQAARYSTSPPIGGPHYSVPGLAPTTTGVHDAPIQNEIQVHNVEHGHIGIQYNRLEPALVERLKVVAATYPDWIFVAPYPAMNEKLALTSWGHLLSCDKPNEKVIDVARNFIADFRDRAPESIPGTPM